MSSRDNIATYGTIKMRQLNTYHSGMAGYLMDFGFGGFIGYGKGVSLELVMEELNISMRYY
jgi:hypothetical protein